MYTSEILNILPSWYWPRGVYLNLWEENFFRKTYPNFTQENIIQCTTKLSKCSPKGQKIHSKPLEKIHSFIKFLKCARATIIKLKTLLSGKWTKTRRFPWVHKMKGSILQKIKTNEKYCKSYVLILFGRSPSWSPRKSFVI